MATVLPTARFVPQSLRTWFLVHFALDPLFGLPLLFIPRFVLGIFNMPLTDTIAPRVVGAALLAIGAISFIANKADVETYDLLLNLKIIWSTAAMLAIFLALLDGSPETGWIFFILFAIFFGTWVYYKQRIWRV